MLFATFAGFGVTATFAMTVSPVAAAEAETTIAFLSDVLLCVVAVIVAVPALSATMWATEPDATPVFRATTLSTVVSELFHVICLPIHVALSFVSFAWTFVESEGFIAVTAGVMATNGYVMPPTTLATASLWEASTGEPVVSEHAAHRMASVAIVGRIARIEISWCSTSRLLD